MKKPPAYPWAFKTKFRARAFGWKSQPAVLRVKEALAEIKSVARQEPMLAAEGGILFLEKVSAALEQVDSSSGALGSAVNQAIADISKIIANAPATEAQREVWLERLWAAQQADEMPYIEAVGDHWGELCASAATASRWADDFMPTVLLSWQHDGGYYKGTHNCFAALMKAERYDDLLALLDQGPSYHKKGLLTEILMAQGKTEEALESALNSSNPYAGEEALLALGKSELAYERFGLAANQRGTYLATFQAIAKKYPEIDPRKILADLVASTPGQEGKWFAAAKSRKFFAEALQLAATSPCEPKTLTGAANKFLDSHPDFALECGLLALHWLVQGHGYEVTGLDVEMARSATLAAAERLGRTESIREQIRALAAEDGSKSKSVCRILARAT